FPSTVREVKRSSSTRSHRTGLLQPWSEDSTAGGPRSHSLNSPAEHDDRCLGNLVLRIGAAANRGLRRRPIGIGMARGRVAVPLILRATQADAIQRAREISVALRPRVGEYHIHTMVVVVILIDQY